MATPEIGCLAAIGGAFGAQALESLVSPTTLVDQAYAVILDAICDGTLKPGERLTQADVAERLNVSRQPIHNALLVLKAQGFLQESGRRGLCVAPLDPALFEAIYQFRSAIEPLAVRLATARMTPADLASRTRPDRAGHESGERTGRRRRARRHGLSFLDL